MTISKLRKRNKISSLLLYVLHKREIRHFHVLVVQKWERNVQKSVVHVQSCYICLLNLLFFWPSRCRPRRWILKSLKSFQTRFPLWDFPCDIIWKRSVDLFSLYTLLPHFRLFDAHVLKGICLLSFFQIPSQSPRYRCPRCPFSWTRVTRTLGTRLSFLELNYACLLTGIGRYLIPSRATILVNSPTSTVTWQSRPNCLMTSRNNGRQ